MLTSIPKVKGQFYYDVVTLFYVPCSTFDQTLIFESLSLLFLIIYWNFIFLIFRKINKYIKMKK